MRRAAPQFPADALQKDRAVPFCRNVFALLRRFVGHFVLQLLRRQEGDLLGKQASDKIVFVDDILLGVAERVIDALDRPLQRCLVPLLAGDDLLPVPLVNEHGMDVVGHLVAADGVHIGIQPLARAETVQFQSVALPFCKRMDNFQPLARAEIKGHRALHAVEIVVQTACGIYKQRSGHADQVQLGCKIALKKVLHLFDGIFGLPQRKEGLIVLRNHQVCHELVSFMWVCFVSLQKKRGAASGIPPPTRRRRSAG